MKANDKETKESNQCDEEDMDEQKVVEKDGKLDEKEWHFILLRHKIK